MFIDPQKSAVDIREMKVRIPSDYYMKLHSLKLLTGTQISEAVTEALKIYFQKESAPSRPDEEVEPSKTH